MLIYKEQSNTRVGWVEFIKVLKVFKIVSLTCKWVWLKIRSFAPNVKIT